MLLEEAFLEAELVDDAINEKKIKSATICSVDMKSFETAVKCPSCNPVIINAPVDDGIVTSEACRSM